MVSFSLVWQNIGVKWLGLNGLWPTGSPWLFAVGSQCSKSYSCLWNWVPKQGNYLTCAPDWPDSILNWQSYWTKMRKCPMLHNGLSYWCHISLGVAEVTKMSAKIESCIFVVEHILAMVPKHLCERKYFLYFCPYKSVWKKFLTPSEGSK